MGIHDTAELAELVLAGLDTIYPSIDVVVSDAIRDKLDKEKEAAQITAKVGAVHYPARFSALCRISTASGCPWGAVTYL